MRRAKEKRAKLSILKWLAVALMVLTLVWAATSTVKSMSYLQWQPERLDTGWTQILEGAEVPLTQVSQYQPIGVGDTLVLTMEIPDLCEEKALFFYTKDVEVAVYCGDSLIYSFGVEEAFALLKTPGHCWNYVDILVEYSGETLRLELTSAFENRLDTTLSGLYLIQPDSAMGVVWMEKGGYIMMSVAVLIMAVVAYVTALVWKRRETRRYYIALANFYLCASLWILPMSGVTNFLFGRPVLSYLVSMLAAIFVPVPIYELIRVVYGKKSRRLNALGILFWGNFIIQFFLQFLFDVCLLDMLLATELVYMVGCLLGVWMILDHYRIHRGTRELNIPFMTILIMIMGGLVEIPVLLLLPERTDLIGVASLTGLAVYLVVNQIYMIYRDSSTDLASVELEENYNKLQNTGLMEQIKAHFFFNTLNTISALCKYDPEQADRAIILFAQYMRSHMNLINQHENIPFEIEMKLVESTLGIEAIRFPDNFSYTIDTPYRDFFVPPLSIQPIVENALIHGLRKKNLQGEVVVRTRRLRDCTVVTITDNGVGFDVAKMDDDTSLGIKNLRKRVELMAKGSVVVESQLGQGTTVTLTFPDVP